jgi:hypothetical protein
MANEKKYQSEHERISRLEKTIARLSASSNEKPSEITSSLPEAPYVVNNYEFHPRERTDGKEFSGASWWRGQKVFEFPPPDSHLAVNDLHIFFVEGTRVEPVLDKDDNAGPFQDIAGNGTSRIELSNPISDWAAKQKLPLKFRSSAFVPKIESWYWTIDGEMVEEKQTGDP